MARIILNAAEHARFHAGLKRQSLYDCWEWGRAKSAQGYGVLWVHPKLQFVHRIAWCLSSGDIPDGMKVLHQCDNRCCANPSHLFLGTDKDNSDDKIRKGRANVAAGEAAGRSILTKENIIQIRAEYPGKSFKKLAREHGVYWTTVREAVHGRTWRTV